MPYAPGTTVHLIPNIYYTFYKHNYPILSLSVVDIQNTMYVQLV